MYCIRTSAVVGKVMPTVREVTVLHQNLCCCRYRDANCKGSNRHCIRTTAVLGTVLPTVRDVTILHLN